MANKLILQGTAKWSYDFEMSAYTATQKALASMTSFVAPLHRHEGNIALSNKEIIIEALTSEDESLSIPLNKLKQIYLGFDQVFTQLMVKGFGLFWQPLRITYQRDDGEIGAIYLIIDYNGIFTHDKDWYNTLTSMLA